MIISADVLRKLHQEALQNQAAVNIDALFRLEDAPDLDGAACLVVAVAQLVDGAAHFADADGHLVRRLAHQRLLQRLCELVKVVNRLHIRHFLNQHNGVAIHVQQHVLVLHRRNVPQQVIRALVFGLYDVEEHNRAIHLLRQLMLVAERLQLAAHQVAPECTAIDVAAALGAVVAGMVERGNQHRRQLQHVARPRLLFSASQHNMQRRNRHVQTAQHGARVAFSQAERGQWHPVRQRIRICIQNRNRYTQPIQHVVNLLLQTFVHQRYTPLSRRHPMRRMCTNLLFQYSTLSRGRKANFAGNRKFFVNLAQKQTFCW